MSSRHPRARFTIATLAVFAVVATAAVSSPAMAAPPPDKGKPSPTDSPSPAPTEPLPDPSEPAPLPSETAPSEPTPAPSEPTPTPTESEPSPAPSTPAPVPPTPAPAPPEPAPPAPETRQLAPTVSAYPDVMAAAGDSITTAYNSASYGSYPQYSWSTGTASTLNSLRQRLAAASGTTVTGVNVAQLGANSAGLAAQVTSAITAQADFLTVEIGANDACTPTVEAMTPTADFRLRVQAALAQFLNAKADNKVLVASIPNLYRMWSLSKSKFGARLIWASAKICQSMLANPTSTTTTNETRRLAVQARVNEYNAVLQQECAALARCTFDNFAVANYAFTSTHISTADYFHPSVAGQKVMASITWQYVRYPSSG